MNVDYDDCGTINIGGKEITRLSEDRREWLITCSCCGKVIAMSDKRIETWGDTDLNAANTGLLWCHHWKTDEKPCKNIFEQIIAHLDHPSFCKSCLAKLKKKGWDFCDCGCGG